MRIFNYHRVRNGLKILTTFPCGPSTSRLVDVDDTTIMTTITVRQCPYTSPSRILREINFISVFEYYTRRCEREISLTSQAYFFRQRKVLRRTRTASISVERGKSWCTPLRKLYRSAAVSEEILRPHILRKAK